MKFETECRESEKNLKSQEQFIQTVKGQNNLRQQNVFLLVPGSFSYLINQNNYNSNWKKKILAFRNMQEKLEKTCS